MKNDFDVPAEFIRKYNQPVPRYTSYPTVPSWNEHLHIADWKQIIQKQFEETDGQGISLYIHLPFCESLCTYCGCNKKITANHSVEERYIAALEKEWNLYKAFIQQVPVIRELHIGGGTPTFFSAANLERIMQLILKDCIIHPLHEFGIEGHPNNTTLEQLETLYKLGFRRISYGVQDNDPTVQKIINRIQPFENVKAVTENARVTGFTSVNFDLIYGLPFQTKDSIRKTIEQVITLKPDRIAFYSYAHVPWTSKAQRLFDETDLPSPEDKIGLYLEGKKLLLHHGYADIGMDHFALPHDDLYKARINGSLHRNFMGYTTQHTNILLGLGVSAISDASTAFAQNDKTLNGYYSALAENRLPIKKGYLLNREDLLFRKNIKEISCTGRTVFQEEQLPLLKEYSFPQLRLLAEDGLVQFDSGGCMLTAKGYYFIRNVCSAFDLHLQRNISQKEKLLFSKAI